MFRKRTVIAVRIIFIGFFTGFPLFTGRSKPEGKKGLYFK